MGTSDDRDSVVVVNDVAWIIKDAAIWTVLAWLETAARPQNEMEYFLVSSGAPTRKKRIKKRSR